jgi:Protein of unknown function (DUF3108)
MIIHRFQTQNLKRNVSSLRTVLAVLFAVTFALSALTILQNTFAQETIQTENLVPTHFKVGEKLTYNISFGKFKNAVYAETYVASRGKLGEKDAIEVRSKIKTNAFVSAAFYLVDESRTTFVSALTGFPLYVRKTSNAMGLPRITSENYLVSPTANYDLLTLIYHARIVGGNGNFPLFEDDKNYSMVFLNSGSERVITDAGDFDTSSSTVTGEYLTEKGITDLKINFTNDDARIPVLIRFKTEKGDFRAELSSIQNSEPIVTITKTPTPTPIATPVPTPRPVSTPAPYIDNQPLSADIAFKLGETLEYRITASGQLIGFVTLHAKDRTLFAGLDSLQLKAFVSGSDQASGIFNLNEGISAQVDPDSLAPQSIELKFSGVLSQYNQTARFDQKNGTVTFNGVTSPDVPVGTHSLLSLAYAIRSFNLKPSKDPSNPVNDTRVAVFFGDKATVVTIRPSGTENLPFDGTKIPSQMVSISTGNPNFDRFNLKLWLSADENRLPMKLSAGIYQADLIKRSNSLGR